MSLGHEAVLGFPPNPRERVHVELSRRGTSLEPQTVNPGQGVDWLAAGWRMFLKSPAIWVVGTIIFFIITLILELVPFLGSFLFSLIAPVLVAGYLYVAKELDEGRAPGVIDFFQGFQDNKALTPLLTIGAISVITALAITILFAILIGGSIDRVLTGDVPPVDLGLLGLGLVLTVIFLGILGMAMFFAIPLVMFSKAPAIPALQSSLWATLHNVLPLTVFSLLATVLMILAAIPFGLGFLILIPMMFGAQYHAYKSIYP